MRQALPFIVIAVLWIGSVLGGCTDLQRAQASHAAETVHAWATSQPVREAAEMFPWGSQVASAVNAVALAVLAVLHARDRRKAP
jgi:hypothetical protein